MKDPLTAYICNEYYSISIFLLHSYNNTYGFHNIRKDSKVQQNKKQAEVEGFEEFKPFSMGSDSDTTRDLSHCLATCNTGISL